MGVVAADLTPGAVFEEWWPFQHYPDNGRRDFLKFANGGRLHFLAESRGENDLIATIWSTAEEDAA
jgi:hypothetical protein